MVKKREAVVLLEKMPAFEDALSSFTLYPPSDKNQWSYFEVYAVTGVDQNSRLHSTNMWVVWYKVNQTITIESIRKKLEYLLIENKHHANEEICNIILTVFAMIKNIGGSAVDRLNLILSRISDAELSQFFTFKHRLPMHNTFSNILCLGNFFVGPFPSNIVESRCGRAGSDYATRYRNSFNDYKISIYCEPQIRKVIDFNSMVNDRVLDMVIINKLYPIIDYYFFALSQLYFVIFFTELKKVQEIPKALGSGWFDVDKMMQWFDTDRLSIWLDIGGKQGGWVSPGANGHLRIDLGGYQVGMPYVYAELKRNYGIIDNSTELYKVISLYCSYIAKARTNDHADTAESLLNYVIALDLLLGKEGNLADSFSNRCSVLTYLILGREYRDLVRDCRQVYNARSKYVHEGKVPEHDSVIKIYKVAREIAFCLFRLSKNSWANCSGFHEKWISYIDVLVAKINAGQQPSPEDYSNAGVAQIGEYSYLDLDYGLSQTKT